MIAWLLYVENPYPDPCDNINNRYESIPLQHGGFLYELRFNKISENLNHIIYIYCGPRDNSDGCVEKSFKNF